MKTIVVIAAGAADRPMEDLGGRTPLEAATTPHLDTLARRGRLGRVTPASKGLAAEEGAFALSLFGLDPREYHEIGAVLDAATLGVTVGSLDQAFRLSLVTADDHTLYDPRAGGIRREEAAQLLEALAGDFGDEVFEFTRETGVKTYWSGVAPATYASIPCPRLM